ncbi:hypothetical protein NIES4071_44040 [Calothrix sp. NIES-4071]|nr:hypothetical protein NIES4071_44040 [Calothrix sp. NIES-4071]BAZ58718.1 hypothetical protein NIES4105_43970 [Calothrix sp. NIES-4105]
MFILLHMLLTYIDTVYRVNQDAGERKYTRTEFLVLDA